MVPEYILFAQHGWADTNQEISELARALAIPKGEAVSPNLGYLKTWWRMAPLVAEVERVAIAYHDRHPQTPFRIIGHSMGGLIWLEILARHEDWWPQVERFTLIGSPVGGSDWGRIIDPLRWGVGIARDLGINRRALAEKIAQQIPTQIIAGNSDGGSDGTVTLQCTQFRHAQYLELPGIKHEQLKNHPQVLQAIQQFWADPSALSDRLEDSLTQQLISHLQTIKGMTDAHYRDFPKASIWANLTTGLTLRTWKNPAGVHHVFLADAEDRCLFAGFVGWTHTNALYKTLETLKSKWGIP